MKHKLSDVLRTFAQAHGSVQIDRMRIKNAARDAESGSMIITSVKQDALFEHIVEIPENVVDMITVLLEEGNSYPSKDKGVPGIIAVVIDGKRTALAINGDSVALNEDGEEVGTDYLAPIEIFYMSFMAAYLTGEHTEAERFKENALSFPDEALKDVLSALNNIVINNFSRRFTVLLTDAETGMDAVDNAVDALAGKVKETRQEQIAMNVQMANQQLAEILVEQLGQATEWDVRYDRLFGGEYGLQYYSSN